MYIRKRHSKVRICDRYSTTVLIGHEAQRKPDLTLIDQGMAADWRCVQSVGEMKSKRNFESDQWYEVIYGYREIKSSMIFASQDNQNFILALRFAKYDMVVYRFDCDGLMHVTLFSINGPTGWKYFTHVAYSLTYRTLDLVGYDTSCHTAPHFPPRYMALQVQPAIHWIQHIPTHIAYTLGIIGINNVPTIHEEYVVGKDYYSATATAHLGPLMTAQVATAFQNDASIKLITQFKTRCTKMCINSLTDGSDDTLGWEIGGVLGDWSFSKYKDIKKVSEHLGNRRGFPVSAPIAGRDVSDYREVTTDVDSDWDTKRGNTAFVSVRLMLGLGQLGIEHGTCDDLKSFFFVLLIIMVVFHAPGVQRLDAEFVPLELDKMWWNLDQWKSSVKWKILSMKLHKLWQDNIACLFSDYFQCWTSSEVIQSGAEANTKDAEGDG
ncbi:uncharacterized protein F5891DRAFT_980511 [Suillus fuscotomentosus]|uniref:Fungal-type protein kinase domain-containing protein n=1 Tax=Suillus fuscotomentosus TaxID=1912939 RepID=A0AAD4E6L7_9AGAM|nr:uncharacterized protein F5891DRAFT_980511 [Suillus fuscotomentosus]KAG1900241.1 hypothetical protein F5891DRAFT_980511 [Suillus fuscotomentosus]